MACCSSVAQTSCACGPAVGRTESTRESELIRLMEKVSRVALGFFAYSLLPQTFTIAFVVGAVGGAAYAMHEAYHKRDIHEVDALPACAQNYMGMLSGINFPAATKLLATAVFVYRHILHDPEFFVPFTGCFVGAWAGKQIGAPLMKLGTGS